MKKLIIIILSIIFIAAFTPARYGVSIQKHSDTLWKPYQIINQVNGVWTAHWIKGTGNYSGTYPALVVLMNQYGDKTIRWLKADSTPTGKVAKFNFTDSNYPVTGWNDCVYADSASFTPVKDASTGFTIGVYNPSTWNTYHGANHGYTANDGGGYAYPDTVVNSLWYNFMTVGRGQSFVPNIFLSGLDTTKLYKIQFLSSTWGTGGSDTVANYAAIIFQAGVGSTDTLSYGYGSGNAFHNTSKTITTVYIKPVSGKINMQLGVYGNPYSGYGEVNGMVVTEYSVTE